MSAKNHTLVSMDEKVEMSSKILMYKTRDGTRDADFCLPVVKGIEEADPSLFLPLYLNQFPSAHLYF